MTPSRLDQLAPALRGPVAAAVEWLAGQQFGGARWGLVLGSGLGNLVEAMDSTHAVAYGDIPGYATTTVAEHDGRLVRGRVGNTEVLAMQGRLHPYEGLSAGETLLPTAVMACLGIEGVVITNAAGGLNRFYLPGDLMVIRDQIDLHPNDPLRGLLADPLGAAGRVGVDRVPSAVGLYDPDLARSLAAAAARVSVAVHAGTYCSMPGPAYESRAEIGLLRRAGGDAVGMSTAPEASLLHRLGVKVAGLSCITNPARETGQPELSHNDVVEVGRRVRDHMARLLLAFLDPQAES
ncbi:purine-nucleoside phosphorylase [bacterium]|nr:MAG: purine-nucleoside phosphorylase [bacterium]